MTEEQLANFSSTFLQNIQMLLMDEKNFYLITSKGSSREKMRKYYSVDQSQSAGMLKGPVMDITLLWEIFNLRPKA